MVGKLIIEILILWILYALYMAILMHKRGPLGGIFFYPKVMQERVIEIGLMTEKELKRRRTFAYILLLALMILVPGFMILRINGAQTYFSCCWQFYVLFLGAEFFDWLVDHPRDGRSERYMAQCPCKKVEDAAVDSVFHTDFCDHRWVVLGNKSSKLILKDYPSVMPTPWQTLSQG